MILFFILSMISFVISIHFFIATKKPGVYPPKYLLKKRTGTMAVAGVTFLIIGVIIRLLH